MWCVVFVVCVYVYGMVCSVWWLCVLGVCGWCVWSVCVCVCGVCEFVVWMLWWCVLFVW